MTNAAQQPPCAEQSVLLRLINGYQISQAIHVIVVLGIPDLLGDRALPADMLAERTGSHPQALHRVLRALAATGVLAEGAKGFSLAPLGRALRSDCGCSRNAWARFALRPAHWQAWGAMLHTVRTGENAFRAIHGMDVWSYRAAHAMEGATFDAAMQERSACLGRALPTYYDFSQLRRIVDVGGGNGALLGALLQHYAGAHGTLLDLPAVVKGAGQLLAAAGVGERCSIVAGDFFKAVPTGGDAYLLKHILHDWPDAEALAILRRCRLGMEDGARLLIIERLLGAPSNGGETELSDLNMLINAGGHERSKAEFADLLTGADFAIAATYALPHGQHLIEALPVSGSKVPGRQS